MDGQLHSVQNGQGGMALIEVLVTLIILLIGLLGLAGLQLQAQRSEMESYQRVQALILLQDMVARLNTNRKVTSCYAVTDSAVGAPYFGTDSAVAPACASGTTEQNAIAIQDMTAWSDLLKGAAEAAASGNTGAMIGARGCVSQGAADPNLYTVSVAWQGLGDSFAPVDQNCGKDLYGSEAKRRVVSMSIRMADLS
jgi:type IV pilus assembly protein PilV